MTAASNVIIGWNATLQVSAAVSPAAVDTLIGEVKQFTPPNAKADQLDATHFGSPGRTKEKKAGMLDLGDTAFETNCIPGDATDDFLNDWKDSGEVRTVKFNYPNGAWVSYPGILTSYGPKPMSPSGLVEASGTITVAGEATRG